MKPVAYHCEADVEVVSAARRYRCQQEELGRRFLRALQIAVEDIRKSPDRFPYYDRPLRARRVAGFPYRVVYEELEDCIHILSVMHTSREQEFLKNRLS